MKGRRKKNQSHISTVYPISRHTSKVFDFFLHISGHILDKNAVTFGRVV